MQTLPWPKHHPQRPAPVVSALVWAAALHFPANSRPKAQAQLVSTWVVEVAASYPMASDLEDLFCAAHVKAPLPLGQQHDCLALAAQASLAAVACQMTKVYQRGCLLLHHRLGGGRLGGWRAADDGKACAADDEGALLPTASDAAEGERAPPPANTRCAASPRRVACSPRVPS